MAVKIPEYAKGKTKKFGGSTYYRLRSSVKKGDRKKMMEVLHAHHYKGRFVPQPYRTHIGNPPRPIWPKPHKNRYILYAVPKSKSKISWGKLIGLVAKF